MIRNLLLRILSFLQSVFLPRTLRAKIMLLIGLVNLFILTSTTIGLTSYVSRLEYNAWHGRQLEAARNAAQTIDSFLQRNRDVLLWIDLLGYDDVIQQPDVLYNVLDHYSAFLEIALLDTQGRTVANAARGKPLFENLYTTPQSQWFRTARGGQEYYTRVQISPQEEPYLIYAIPVQDGMVMAARIRMDVLHRVVADIHFGKGGSVFVINQLGQVNAHTDHGIVLANTSLGASPEFVKIMQSPRHEWFGQRWNFSHQRVVSVSTAVGLTGWTVITELPESEAYAASRTIRVALPVGLFLLLFATTWVIRYVMAQIFLKSVDALRDGAARFGEGDLTYRIPIPRMDELGEAMAVFNQMAVRLEAQRFHLEQSRKQLQESEQRYRLLAEHASDVIWLRDLNLRLLYTSPSELRMSGFTPEEAIQRSLEQTLTPASYAAAVEYYSEILAQMADSSTRDWMYQSRTLETEVYRKDGSTLWTESHLVFLPDAEGNPAQILGVTRDISLRKQVEQELRALNEQLEQRVSIRTAELSKLNEDLLQEIADRKRAEEQLQASLHEKVVLLKEIHHRVKNNLQIISSLLNLQARSVTDLHTLNVLSDSQGRVRSMALIHEKLYQSDDLAQINFREYLNSLVPSLLRSYHHSGGAISLRIEADDTLIPLESAIPCGLIVNELVTNTLKYAFPGERGGTLRIELRQSADHMNLLRIADDGVGLPPDLDIFRTNSLGLRLVNTLVSQIEGTLVCNRQEGVAFEITFRNN